MSYVFGSIQVEDNFTGARSYVRVATAVAGTLATSFANGQSVDGVTLVTGDRILIKDQASGAENGIYLVEAAGAPTRANDLQTGEGASGMYTWARVGTLNGNTAWICTNAPGSDVTGTDALTFAQFDVVSDLTVARGGTGVSSLTSGRVLVGAGTAAVDLSKAAPTGDFVGTTDAQTLSSKTLDTPSIDGDVTFIEATNNLVLSVSDQVAGTATLTIPDMGGVSQTMVLTNQSQTLTNKTLTAPVLNSVPTLSLDDTDSAFDLTIQSTSTLTAGRTLILDVNDATRTLSMGGDITTAGNFTTTGAFAISLTATGATNLTLPTSGTLANQAYVDSVAQGLDVKQSVRATTTTALNSNASISGTITYNATGGSSGRGQITATLAVSDTFTIDGVTISAAGNGTRVLLKNEASGANPNGARNGIWTTTISGTSLTLDRATDFDADSEVTSGAFTFTEEGTINASTGWVLTTPDPITIGGASGTVLTFTLFSSSGSVIAGAGLTKNGNQLDVNTSTTIAIVSNNVVVNSSNTANQILLSTGTAGTEATFGALPLGDNNAVTGILGLSHGGTNANLSAATGSRIIQTNAGATALETTTSPRVAALTSTADGDNYVTFTDSGTTANYFNVTTGLTSVAPTFRSVGEANIGMILSDSNANELLRLTSVASAVNEVAITNAATGTNPIIRASGEANRGLILADSNSNEVLILASTASAVNEMTLTNSATAGSPTLSATGGDTNISMSFQAKGTGVYRFLSTATAPGEIRLFETTGLGSNYVGLDVPDVTTSYTLSLPPAVGTTQQVLRLADNSGNLEFATIAAATGQVGYSIWAGQISVSSAASTTFAYFAWDQSQYSGYNAGNVIFWHGGTPSNRTLTVDVYNGSTTIGSVTVPTSTAAGIATFSLTNPVADVRLEFRANKSAASGANVDIFGIQMEFTHS
jgi:hypothetical protein